MKPENFIDPEYIPTGLQIRDPSKMQYTEVQKLSNFLLDRQILGQTIFRFKAVLPQHKRGKKIVERPPIQSTKNPQTDNTNDGEESLPYDKVKKLAIRRGKRRQVSESSE